MNNIIELSIFIIILTIILIKFQNQFDNFVLILFLSLFVFNLLSELTFSICHNHVIKMNIIEKTLKYSLQHVAIFIIFNEILMKYSQISSIIRILIIIFIIGLFTKQNKRFE